MACRNSFTNISRYLFESHCALESTTSWDNRKMYLKDYGDYKDSDAEPMYPAILQTSRVIYAEAAPQLYARTTINMAISDVVYLSERERLVMTPRRGEQKYGATIHYVAWVIVMRKVYRSMLPMK